MGKRIISVLVTVSCIIGMFQGIVIGDYETQPNKISEYDKSCQLFEALTGEQLFNKAEEQVTRGQFATMLIKACNAYFPTEGYHPSFTFSDVRPESEYYYSIGCLADAGAVSKANSFRADDVILMNEAIKMAVSFVGYEIMAEDKGGYPNGYLNTANEMELLKNVSFSAELTNENAAIMMYNLMLADAMTYTNETRKYQKSKDNYLKLYYNVDFVKGVVNQTAYSSILYEYEPADNGIIQIDGKSYQYNGDDTGLLGKKVTAFYKDDDGLNAIISLYEEENRTFGINGEDYQRIQNERLYYRKEGESFEKSLKLDKLYTIIYNGRRVSAITNEMLADPDAAVTLLDNDGDAAYEVVFIQSSVYGVLKTVDFTNDVLIIESPQQTNISLGNENGCYNVYDASGNKIELAQLEKDMVISASISLDEVIAEIHVLGESVSGSVQRLETEDRILVIDGKSYKTSQAFWHTHIETEGAIKPGTNIDVVITQKGTIVALKAKDNQSLYGYLLRLTFDENMLDGALQLRIFTSGGKIEKIKSDDKIVLNNERLDEKAAFDKLGGENLEPQIIKYIVNKEGKIVRLSTACGIEEYENQNPDYKFGDDLPGDVLLLCAKREATASQYRTNFGGFTGYAATGSAKIFVVPATDTRNEDKYEVVTMSSLPGNTTYDWSAYDIDITGRAGAIVIKLDDNAMREREYSGMIVEKVYEAVDENNAKGYMICGWMQNKFVEYFVDEEVVLETETKQSLASKGIEAGDILRVNIQNNIIENYKVDFEYNSATGTYQYLGDHNNNDTYFVNTAVEEKNQSNYGYYGQGSLCWVEGNIYSTESDYGYIGINSNPNECPEEAFKYNNMRLFKMATTIVCFTRGEHKEIRPISIEELRTYRNSGSDADHVIMQLKDSRNQVIYVIR